MLILARRDGEKIVIPLGGGREIVIELLPKHGEVINPARPRWMRLGITAPADVKVYREEVWRRIEAEGSSRK